MSAAETANAISKKFDTLGAGVPDKSYERVIWQQLAQDFAQLADDLAPSTGWVAATGVADRTSFDTTTVTLANLAKRVKALIDDFLTREELGS